MPSSTPKTPPGDPSAIEAATGEVKPQNPLGTRGKLRARTTKSIGFQRRSTKVDESLTTGRNMLLFNPYKGIRYLPANTMVIGTTSASARHCPPWTACWAVRRQQANYLGKLTSTFNPQSQHGFLFSGNFPGRFA